MERRLRFRNWFFTLLWVAVKITIASPTSAKPESSTVEDHPTLAVLAVHQPGSLAGTYAGYFASFSAWPLPKGDLYVRAAPEEFGCGEYTLDWPPPSFGGLGPAPGFTSMVSRGKCAFEQKALMAQKAGAQGIIIVSNQSDTSDVMEMGAANDTNSETDVSIFVVGMARDSGNRLFNASRDAHQHGTTPPMLSITPYKSSLLNISEGVIILLATALVGLGAFFSTADVRDARVPISDQQNSFTTALAPPEEEVLEVDQYLAVGFCVMGSAFLVLLFFFMQYMIYVIIGCFCLGGASCITQFGGICLTHLFPSLRNRGVMLPLIGPIFVADAIAFVPAAVIVTCWVFLRNTPYGWPFQDIIGAGFLCWLQRTLRLPNIQVASVLLIIMFFFDIFWVFISPLFFHESVMVRVATGGGTGESVPMLLRIPTFGDPFGGDRLLGFGDIALPGLLVSYLRRHDLLSYRSCFAGYFVPSLIGYFVGLNCTIAALCIMRMGQPALLYLVPGTLGTTMVIAACKGEVGLLWRGEPATKSRSDSDLESDEAE